MITATIQASALIHNGATNGPEVYMWPQNDNLKAFKFNGSTLTTPNFQTGPDFIGGEPGAYLSISANGNTNGLVSFNNGNGAIMLDFGPWMTTNYTSATGIPGLIDSLNSLLLGGQLSTGARSNIISYVTNTATAYFPYSSPPTFTQMRDRVRTVVHLIITSPDFTIQK